MHNTKLAIEHKLSEIKKVSDVASHLNVSTETLRKKFLREEKIHLGEYINCCKVIAMQELLIISEIPCFEVCYSIGLREDTGAKLFKKFTGMTMKQFREKYRTEFLKHGKNPLLIEENKNHHLLNNTFDFNHPIHSYTTNNNSNHQTILSEPQTAEKKI